MRWREHEAAARFLDAAADLLRRQIDLHAKRRQHVGRARFRRQSAVAVLGDPEPGTGCDEGGTGRDIIGARGITAGPHDVDRIGGRLDLRHLLAHDLDGAGDLIHRFAAHSQRHQEAAYLRGRGFA